jgi:hypothetical protein
MDAINSVQQTTALTTKRLQRQVLLLAALASSQDDEARELQPEVIPEAAVLAWLFIAQAKLGSSVTLAARVNVAGMPAPGNAFVNIDYIGKYWNAEFGGFYQDGSKSYLASRKKAGSEGWWWWKKPSYIVIPDRKPIELPNGCAICPDEDDEDESPEGDRIDYSPICNMWKPVIVLEADSVDGMTAEDAKRAVKELLKGLRHCKGLASTAFKATAGGILDVINWTDLDAQLSDVWLVGLQVETQWKRTRYEGGTPTKVEYASFYWFYAIDPPFEVWESNSGLADGINYQPTHGSALSGLEWR